MSEPSRAAGHPAYAATRRIRETAARSQPLECGCRDALHRSLNCDRRDDGGASVFDNLPLSNHWRIDPAEAERRLGPVGAPIPYPPRRGDAA